MLLDAKTWDDLRRGVQKAKEEKARLSDFISHAEALLASRGSSETMTLEHLGAPPPAREVIEDSGFPASGSTPDKILYAIRSEGRFLHRSQIEAFINARQTEDVKEGTMSNAVTTMFARGDMIRVQFNNASHLIAYGLDYMVEMNGVGIVYSDPKYRPVGDPFEHADRATRDFQYADSIKEAVMSVN